MFEFHILNLIFQSSAKLNSKQTQTTHTTTNHATQQHHQQQTPPFNKTMNITTPSSHQLNELAHHIEAACVSQNGHVGPGQLVVLFVFSSLVLGTLLEWLMHKVPLPHTSVLLVVGFFIGVIVNISEKPNSILGPYGQGTVETATISPHLLLFIFLPPLIFESAFSINWHVFRKVLSQVVTLAVPGLSLAVLLTGCTTKWMYPSWSWPSVFLFGTIVSATDPVAVVSILKKAGGHPALRTVVEGESLLNDGTAVVFFSVILEIIQCGENAVSPPEAIFTFFKMSIGGPLVGLAMGFFSVEIIGRNFNKPMIEIALPLSTSYLTYFISESVFGFSGVLAVVCLGLYFSGYGRVYISPEVEEYLHSFHGMLAHQAETVIFILSGIFVARQDFDLSSYDFISSFILYIVVHIVRAIVVAVLAPVLRAQGYGLSLDRGILIVWGGLRGAVSLALALSVTLDPIVQHRHKQMAGLMFWHTSMLVMMTLLINATTVKKLVQALGLHLVSPSKELLFGVAMREIDRAGEKEELNLKADPLFSCARWDDVRRYKWNCAPAEVHRAIPGSTGTINGGSSLKTTNKLKKQNSLITLNKKEKTRANSFRQNAELEATRRFLVAVKASYWQQFRDGLVGRAAVRDLIETVDSALDHSEACEWKQLHKSLESTKVGQWTHIFLKHRLTRPLALRYLFSRLRHGYDVMSAFLVARQDAIDHIRAVFTESKVFRKTIDNANMDIEKARSALLTISRVLPEISATIATNHAARVILNTQRRTVNELKEEGVLDETEAKRSVRAIELQMKRLLLHPQRFELPSADELLGEIPWVAALDREARRTLQSNVVELLVQENDVIIKEGTVGTDVFLLARGGARVTQNIGGEDILIQNLQVGGVVGEMACIIGERRSATVTATTTSLFFQIPGNAMSELVQRSNLLRTHLWTVCARRLAEITLSEHEPYRQMSRRGLRNTLQSWR